MGRNPLKGVQPEKRRPKHSYLTTVPVAAHVHLPRVRQKPITPGGEHTKDDCDGEGGGGSGRGRMAGVSG